MFGIFEDRTRIILGDYLNLTVTISKHLVCKLCFTVNPKICITCLLEAKTLNGYHLEYLNIKRYQSYHQKICPSMTETKDIRVTKIVI